MDKFDPMNLTEEEMAYIIAIVTYTRNKYIKENEKYMNDKDIDTIEEKYLVSKCNIENEIIKREEESVDYSNIEYIFEDELLFEILKALTLREKLVLFLYYFGEYTDKRIGDALLIDKDSAGQIRRRAINKIIDKYNQMKGK